MQASFATMQRAQRRRGTLYISVLGTALMVSIAGMTAMHLARTELRAVAGDCDTTRARLAAEAAVAYGLATIEQHADWQTRFTAGVPVPGEDDWVQLDQGSKSPADFQFVLTAGSDEDGTLRALDQVSPSSIALSGVGRSGGSLSVIEVQLEAVAPLPVLDTALSAAGNIDLMLPPTGQLQVRVDNVVYAGGNIVCVEGNPTIRSDAEAVGTITDNIATGTETEGVTPRVIPAVNIAFDYYLQHGTRINLDSSAGEFQISRVLISPSSNPFSSETNPEGIYVIDCRGRTVRIEESRILGTLVLLDNADDSIVAGPVNWAPAVENYPALMTENGCILSYDSKDLLSERTADVNFNPPGVSYNGVEDNDKNDNLANEINGLVYIGGELNQNAASCSRINGLVVCNSAVLAGDIEINHSRVYVDSPPPGFAEPTPAQVKIGSWHRGEN